MIYKNIPPSDHLCNHVKSFWMVDSEGETTIQKEKIIPDGYPEMIFHYGDPYRANISGQWYNQEKNLLAGQITNHFFLENTGKTGMIGIKFQPWALNQLFDIEMNEIVNRVISLPDHIMRALTHNVGGFNSKMSIEEKIKHLQNNLTSIINAEEHERTNFQNAVELIIATKGTLPLKEIKKKAHVSERSLERYFKKYIGISPKLYSRIIRFSSIFQLIQTKDFEWTEISFLSGFYDQSHFIKNFQEFTGEDPSNYGFNQKNMANLFLKSN